MQNTDSIFTILKQDIHHSDINDHTRTTLLHNLDKLKATKINIMVTGATGAGKSSTINALFNMDIAKVGTSCEPETSAIVSYTLNNLVLWDTAGLGDGKRNDLTHANNIKKKLDELDNNGKPIIDLVLVIIDGSTRDLGTSSKLINEIIIPNLGDKPEERILVAINQADVALKGPEAWDHESNKPTPKAKAFLNRKALSVKNRIHEATGINIEPIYYVAGYTDGHTKQKPYNMSKLLFLIVSRIPKNKRIILAEKNISNDTDTWSDDDKHYNYAEETKRSIWDSIVASTTRGADIGGDIGSLFGNTGEAIGRLIGGSIGAISGGILGLWGF